MRRFLAITTIMALLATPAAPLFAASCPHAALASGCVGRVHDCEMMHDHGSDATESEAQPEGSVLQSRASSSDCPMDCCAPGERTNAVVVVATPISSRVISTEFPLQFTPRVLTSSGFSSHTDRGPPAP